MKKNIIFAITILFFISANAATVDTVAIYSKAMNKSLPCVVIKPSGYESGSNRYPVVYLLHGHSGNYSNWIQRVPDLKTYVDQHQIIVVCPDGGFNSWYLDSPVDTASKFETYVGKEIPEYIDAHYNTIQNKKARAITGLSMGGHGGLFLGFRHQDVFGACGSMSGGVDLRPFPRNWQLGQKLGDTIQNADNWKNYSVVNVIEKYTADSLAIIVDCGTEDFFYDVNKALHEKMLKLKIKHDYIERPGRHDWPYWNNAIKYQLLFFKNYFDRNK